MIYALFIGSCLKPSRKSAKCTKKNIYLLEIAFEDYTLHIIYLRKVSLPYDPSCPSFGWLVGQSVSWLFCYIVLKGLEVTLPQYSIHQKIFVLLIKSDLYEKVFSVFRFESGQERQPALGK